MRVQTTLFTLCLLIGTRLVASGPAFAADRGAALRLPDGTTQPGTKWALVIGINDYPESVGPLQFAAADAKRMAECLIQDAGFPAENVQLLTDEGLLVSGKLDPAQQPTYTTLRGRISSFAQDHRNTDTLLVFFSGHGFHSVSLQKDFLAPRDVQPTDLEGTAVRVDTVLGWLRDSGARQSVLIVDACRNLRGKALGGGGIGEESLNAAKAQGIWYLTSCKPGQISRENEQLGGGYYTYYLVEGLRGAADGCAGQAKDGLITVTEATVYVEEKVEAATRAQPPPQIPCHSEFDVSGGEMVLSVPRSDKDVAVTAPAVGFEDVLKPAVLHISSDPAGAEVLLDGKATGKQTPCDLTIADVTRDPRRCEVTVRKGGFVAATKAGQVVAGMEARLDFGKLTAIEPAVVRPPTPPKDVTVTPVAPAGPAGNRPWERPGTRAGEEIIGPDGGVMVWLPPGEFTMGSTDEDVRYAVEKLHAPADWLKDEQPAHRVRITKGFWLGKCEVTNEQYAKFLNEYGKLKDGQGHELIDLSESWCGVEAVGNGFRAKAGRGKHPVVEVSWYGAKAYCDYYGLSLPTEAQWEYAARGPEGRRYPWGNESDPSKWCNDDNRGTGDPPTMEVGSLPAGNSWCGAADLAGNVWEWCADWYDENYYARSPLEDPTGPTSGEYRLLRGGSWDGNPGSCRAADRYRYFPGCRDDDRGFRAARTP